MCTRLQEQYQQNEAVMSEDEVRRMNSDAQDLQVQLQLIQEDGEQKHGGAGRGDLYGPSPSRILCSY